MNNQEYDEEFIEGYTERLKEEKKRNWQALQAFYRLKSLLLPEFIQRNKQCLNSIEAELMREYQKGGGENENL